MNKAWRVALLWGAMVLAFGLMGLVGHGASSRRTLERYKADLRAKGEKLTYVELMRLRIAHTNDSLVRLTNAVARLQSGNQPVQPAYLQVRKYVGGTSAGSLAAGASVSTRIETSKCSSDLADL